MGTKISKYIVKKFILYLISQTYDLNWPVLVEKWEASRLWQGCGVWGVGCMPPKVRGEEEECGWDDTTKVKKRFPNS